MFFARLVAASLLAATTLANPVARQTTNTNPRIHDIVSALDMNIHDNVPDILNLQASHTASDDTIAPHIDDLTNAFRTAAEDLADTAVSSGSNTTSPTNDQLGVIFSETLSLLASGLSGLTTTMVPSLTSMYEDLDAQAAAAATAFNTTSPNGLALVHIMLLDVSQFFEDEGFTATLAATGF